MSKIEVNKIGPQCGTTLTVGCGAGQTVAVDANTVTIGRCGGTVALASGATQTGFGRTGTVDWNTTPKTTNFTANKDFFNNIDCVSFGSNYRMKDFVDLIPKEVCFQGNLDPVKLLVGGEVMKDAAKDILIKMKRKENANKYNVIIYIQQKNGLYLPIRPKILPP